MRDSSNAGASPPAQAESETADTHDEKSSIAGEKIEKVASVEPSEAPVATAHATRIISEASSL